MTQLDYTFDRQLTLEREEAREEGRAEGRAEGREEGRTEGREEGRTEGREQGLKQGRIMQLLELVRDGVLDKDLACKRSGLSAEEFEKRLNGQKK